MKFLNESYSTVISEAKVIFAKRGNKVVKKFRCLVGKRKGRIVGSPKQCNAPLDLKKRYVMRRTRAAKGARMMKKAQRVKRTNPASKIVRSLNKNRR
jgi:hypothetical protein|tara:strand:+ start:5713 stop:6003 length:291 start_codon:yes stop_codon:yes gene_type:complete